MNSRVATVCGFLAAACAVLRLGAEPSSMVPGLFVAAPIVWAGLWAAAAAQGAKSLRLDGRLVAIVGAFTLAVLATQYARGGGVEWGGRFFALALPVVVSIAVAGLRTQPAMIVRCVVVAAAALSVLAVREMHDIHGRTDDLFSNVRVPFDAVAVTTAGLIPRLDWRRYDERQWLLVDRADAAELLDRLRSEGVGRAFLLYPRGQRPEGVSGTSERVGQTRWRTVNIVLD
ncbi:MAG: hypothetical protein Q8K63_15470, partial [Acidimicrobiales bacterium]|nr:hypothetical protein [Acidimicrobiales bacterium]